jgi:hypothetical protein
MKSNNFLSRTAYWKSVRDKVEEATGKTFLVSYVRDLAHGIKEPNDELRAIIEKARKEVLEEVKSRKVLIKKREGAAL